MERKGTRKGKEYQESVSYISSLSETALGFASGIRGHWSIENRLHWTKDVVLQEDRSKIRLGNAPANLSIIRAIVLNLMRCQGYSSITSSQRFLAHALDKLLRLVE